MPGSLWASLRRPVPTAVASAVVSASTTGAGRGAATGPASGLPSNCRNHTVRSAASSERQASSRIRDSKARTRAPALKDRSNRSRVRELSSGSRPEASTSPTHRSASWMLPRTSSSGYAGLCGAPGTTLTVGSPMAAYWMTRLGRSK